MSEISWKIIAGDCRTELQKLPAGSVHTVVTSPPYFGLRDYGALGQIGLEPTPDEFVAAMVEVFREVRRVLRDDGTVWLNLGDSYNAGRNGGHAGGAKQATLARHDGIARSGANVPGCKPKDLIGIPWMVAFALRADGWYLRSEIIWAKPNPMPESVTDRPTRSHEYIFLLTKGARYFYDSDAIREPHSENAHHGLTMSRSSTFKKYGEGNIGRHVGGAEEIALNPAGRNKRDVWTVSTKPYPGAHFATFPPDLIEPCVLAGCPERSCGECGAPWVRIVEVTADGPGIESPKDREAWEARWGPRGGVNEASVAASRLHGQYHNVQRQTRGFEPSCACDVDPAPGVVLDPFAGAGTTGLVATRHARSFIGIELNPEYAELARWRIRDDAPLFNAQLEAA